MTEITTKLMTDESELDKEFKVTEESLKKGLGRKPKMALPGHNASIRVRVCFTKIGDAVGIIYQTHNDAFENESKTANFMTVEPLDDPGVEREMNCSSSLYSSLRKICAAEGMTINDLGGKVLIITGDYWTKAPIAKRNKKNKCPCGGKGCKLCIVTGTGVDAGKVTGLIHPVLHNAQFDKEFMSKETISAPADEEDDY